MAQGFTRNSGSGGLPAATQSQQETGTSVGVATTPGRQQYHQSSCKVWINFNGAGAIIINGSYNVTSVTDNGTGDWIVNFIVPFSAMNTYSAVPGHQSTNLPAQTSLDVNLFMTTSVKVRYYNGGVAADTAFITLCCFGDQ